MIRGRAIARFIDVVRAPRHARRCRQGFIALLLLTVLIDLLVPAKHGIFFSGQLPGWHALAGLLCCLLIVAVAKLLGHRCGLMKREDYYDD